MPVLEWIGKEKVVNHANEVPFHVLERSYSYGNEGKTAEDNGSGNKIIHGDNLVALKSLLPEYEGRVKCIYIDKRSAYLIQSCERVQPPKPVDTRALGASSFLAQAA